MSNTIRCQFSLDIRVHADIIAAIEVIANGGPMSLALQRVMVEWYQCRCNGRPAAPVTASANPGFIISAAEL